jgi:4-hydroxybenzoyl-CoA thioesterase
MFATRRTVRIEWGDCDPAGIVFYPRYFAMFNHSTELLIERALGIKKYILNQQYGLGGYPSVATKARFLLPTRYGDDVEIESAFTKIGRSSFSIQHTLSLDGALAVEGNETRVWAIRDPGRPGGFRAEPLPEQMVARFSATAPA